MLFDDLKRRLPARLGQPLPGPEGQARMSPRPRFGWREGEVPADARRSGVLLLLYPVEGRAHLVLTVRNPDLQHHAGQVSLPGGATERDESIEQAALREAREEVGVDAREVEIVGALTPLHVPVSGYVLHPRVGFAARRPVWQPDRREVARVLEVSLDRLCDPAALGREWRGRGDRTYEVPFFRLDGEKVWGATAMVLSELLCLLGSPPEPWLALGA